ncbi:MAG TPA: discoidin domain-containing protein [Puia sp.]|nr:discoidin domain-containing protein [Puia sp.]
MKRYRRLFQFYFGFEGIFAKKTVIIFIFVFSFCIQHLPAQVNVLTQHNDLNRTGWNPNETILNTTNVNPNTFGKLYSRPVDDQIFAQPLIVSNLSIAGGAHNIVIVATTNNSIYAFDAEDSSVTAPYWQVNLTQSGMRPPTNNDISVKTYACGSSYKDIIGKVGIIGTPVIDTSTNTLYVVARSVSNEATPTVWQQYLHALDIRTGAEKTGSPVMISATISGTGDGSSGGQLSFDPASQNQRPGLLLLNGLVYITYSSHCDAYPYHGWIFGYDAASLQQKIIFNTSPNDGEGGIWMCGAAPSADDQGNIYVASGNGTGNITDANNVGESTMKLTPNASKTALTVTSSFTPYNYKTLNTQDLDFGVTNVLLLPNTNLALAGCKDGNLYLLDRNNMGGFTAGGPNNVIQQTLVGQNLPLHTSIAYYEGPTNKYVYILSESSVLKAYPIVSNLLGTVVNGTFQGPIGYTGGFLSVSSNGSTASSAILWTSHSVNCNANQATCPGILRALDANDITKELWNSSINSNDTVGNFAKFSCPTIANGKVYLATFSNKLLVYGLNQNNSCINGTNIALNKTATASSTANGQPASNAVDGNMNTYWSSSNSDNQNLTIDLGVKYDICAAVIHWDATNFGKNYSIQVSNDGTSWVTNQTITGNTSKDNTINLQLTGYRYIRIQATLRNNSSGPYSIYEFQVYGTISNTCNTPTNVATSNISEEGVTISWDAVPTATGYSILYKTANASTYNTLSSATNSISLQALTCATDYLFQIIATCPAGQSVASNGSFTTSACSVTCNLPTRWSHEDIGVVGVAGSSCNVGGEYTGTYTVQGSGADIGGTTDAFQYVNHFLTADDEVSARIATQDATSSSNKAGIMIREDLSVGSRNAFIAVTSSNGIIFQYRSTTNGSTVVNAVQSGISAPYWLKIRKIGTTYTAYVSTDGIIWTKFGTTVDLGFGTAANPYAGFAVTSNNNSVLSTATIDNFAENASSPLPVQLLSFMGQNIDNQYVLLRWSTASESGNDHFEVESSANGTDFKQIATVEGAGNSTIIQNYSAQDNKPVDGINYYRLKQVDMDGKPNYSIIIVVRFGASKAPVVFPNPTYAMVTIMQGQQPIKEITLYDVVGKPVKHIVNSATSSSVLISLSNIASGVYIIKIDSNKESYLQKLIKR